MNPRYYLTFKSTFLSEKPKKLKKTSFNVKFFDWDYLHLIALKKETYFRWSKFCRIVILTVVRSFAGATDES